ncbi:TROVE domain-containing protein [Pontibacter sp. BT310]|uniref:TROVE domain-containing protein n=1 Tax=Pontibacter populi TaxID=890055 RepID=A0ABS6XBT8_9BACT|nr:MULTISPECIES: TROVE domain-containing protein [Pontibacter]MBJ6118100.1 TROVE domain-containing protein [Pontibacter sp. BT310]MBR0570527.1 TROVE domain-containing protein [Microvirga sp. STS03]MBW3364953.1 TROVE domain-containing protein [Pontibacter populi]
MKFNILTSKKHQTTNHEGALAWKIGPAAELYAAVVTASLSDKFYENGNQRLERIRELIAQNDPVFVAKLAMYARTQMHLRSVPLVLLVELAKVHSGDDLVSRTVAGVVQRADEITELLAYYSLSNGRTGTKKLGRLSKQLQKGLALAFNRFDEYQFAKYNRATEVKLRDALFLVHPKSKDETQRALFDKIATDTLAIPYTWETKLSELGQQAFENAEAKAAAVRAKWEELIDSGRLGYMALLRNLRNILQAEVSAVHMQRVCAILSDARAVQKAKQMPFRYQSAYRELLQLKSGYTAMVLDALEQAVQVSVQNMQGFDETVRVVVACDVSGSMQRPISARSKVLNYDIGLMLGMLLQHRCHNVVTGMFGDSWKVINLPQRQVLSNVQEFYRREGEVGYSTNGYLVIRDLIKRRVQADKVMLFTDCQLWDNTCYNQSISEEWKKYKPIAPNARLYLFDLAGYGNSPLNLVRDDVFLIAGWSDKVFDVLEAIENGSTALTAIEAMEL